MLEEEYESSTPIFDRFVKIMQLLRYNRADGFQGNAAYSILAFYMVTYYAMQLFRYKSKTGYYALGAASASIKTNWYEIAGLTSLYAGFSIWALLSVMQIIASFGVLTAVNVMVWYWSGILGSIVGLAVVVFRLLAVEDSYS
jgi:hypothetical protein